MDSYSPEDREALDRAYAQMSLARSIQKAVKEAMQKADTAEREGKEKVTINFIKYQRDKQGDIVLNPAGNASPRFEQCLVLELDSAKVRAIEACVEYPEAVKALVQDLLDEHQCDHAEIAATLRNQFGLTRFIRTYKKGNLEGLAKARAARKH